LYDLDYDINEIQSRLKNLIAQSNLIDSPKKDKIIQMLNVLLHENNYLKFSPKKEDR
jgi:arginine decarboxylase